MSTTTLSPDKHATSAAIRKDLKVNEKGRTEVPDDLYEKHLPDGITIETVNRLHEHNRTFFLASLEAFGEVSESALKKHKDIDRTSMQINAGDGARFSAQYARSVKRAATGEDGKVGSETTYGALTGKYVIKGGNADDYNAVKERFAKQAKKLFAE
ncbi:hypothetical protein HDG34_003246 [Paraburkholderia sp. HC6.4b]|uniref:hypothetical protein n=1 Tax=unclassified Paraburkholderia TaxID=2615204 RepID=UPI00160781A7|nr:MULTISPECIES: hypothetical protein [unclassified Paraburkholderia]MBB5409305.1 hypothetical protein [Paraburkholderia sp. HC6.4b]MBB5451033.1 hypothetical protein [Paraburkholderia sp. Kb1A]